MPEGLEVCAYFVGYLQDFEFVAEGSAAAVVEVDGYDAADMLLCLDEEAEGWAYEGLVDKVAGTLELVLGAFFPFLVRLISTSF